MSSFQSITVQCSIQASLEKVWDCWTSEDHIIHWNFADPSWCCPSAKNDLRVGGTFLYCMEARDGSFGFDFEGIYDEVILHKRIAYHMSDGRAVSVDFVEVDNQIQVIEQFDAENENPIEMQQAGWQMILENFRKYVER